MADVVNHPNHYTFGGIECIDAIRVVTSGLSGFEAYCTGTVLKYLWRWKHKNGLEDLKKAEVYLRWLIEEVEPDAD
jgi:hypothetical protein